MAIEATFTATEGDFPLAAVFSKFPEARIELDRVVPTNTAVVPYIWLRGVDDTDIQVRDIHHPGVGSMRIVDHLDDVALVRIEWDFDYESVLTAVFHTDVELVSALGLEGKWTFEIRGDDQQAISEFHSYCKDNGIPITLSEIHALSPVHSDREYDLTDTQREALTLAYARGYYDSPREATQEEVAEELDITRQALSSRLHRGTRRLIASTLVHPPK